MKYSYRKKIGKYIICVSMFLLSVIGMVLAALIIKLTFAMLLWFTNGSFDFACNDIFYAIKLGGTGGSILGIGWVLFYLFRVKGF